LTARKEAIADGIRHLVIKKYSFMKIIMGHSCKITGFMMLSVGLSLIAPTIIETTNIFSSFQVNCIKAVKNHSSVYLGINGLDLKYSGFQAPSNCEYNPADFGAPDSWHGSGTR
jgi:hypothetical protein